MIKLLKTGILIGLGLSWKAKEYVDELVKKGQQDPSETAKRLRDWVEATERGGKEVREKLSGLCAGMAKKVKFATQQDLERLEREIAALAAQVNPRR